MEYGAIDLHKKESQIRIVTERGAVVDRRIATTRERFTSLFKGRPPMRVLLEASTESEWVAQHLEGLGHEVIMADPTFAPMYSERSRRIKTDRRDVTALLDACQRGCYRATHRRSAPQRTVQAQLHVRRALTASRTRVISLTRAITRGDGFRVRSGSTGTFRDRVAALDLPATLTATIAPLQRLLETLDEELTHADDRFATLVAQDPVVLRLTTLPGIGPITASAFVAALDEASRFGRASQVVSYLGLVPREYSSGEQQRRGRVLRSAHPYLQSLLIHVNPGRVARVALEGRADRESSRLGPGPRPPAREEDCGGRRGSTRAHFVRDVARRHAVRRHAHATHTSTWRYVDRGGDPARVSVAVVKLEASARWNRWPRLRAVP
jgi:transposase